MLSVILGLPIMFIGFLMIMKTEWFLSNFGRIPFFEEHLGTEGGSRLGYKLTGILIIFIGFLMFTGLARGFLLWILGPFIKITNFGA